MNASFSIHESLEFGWKTFRERSALLLQIVLTLFALQIVQSSVHRAAPGGIADCITYIAQIVLGLGAVLVSLRIARGEVTQYRDILPPGRIIGRYVLAVLLAFVIVLSPAAIAVALNVLILMATIGPTIYSMSFADTLLMLSPTSIVLMATTFSTALVATGWLALRYTFFRYAVIDGAGIRESLATSVRLTRGVKWRLLGFIFAIVGINILGILALLVGLLVSVPVTLLAAAHVYTKLKASV